VFFVQARVAARFRSCPRSGPRTGVALRQRNLSVYDIQRELAAGRHPIGINALTILLREEGFARLPRRRDEERPAALKADSAGVADVRRLDPRCGSVPDVAALVSHHPRRPVPSVRRVSSTNTSHRERHPGVHPVTG